jgi:hypothetical protein
VPQAPVAELEQERDQAASTALEPSVAENVCCPPAEIVAVLGLTTILFAFVVVTVALAVLVVSAWEIAVTVIVLEGTALGAV